jgi:hypothetical protein
MQLSFSYVITYTTVDYITSVPDTSLPGLLFSDQFMQVIHA